MDEYISREAALKRLKELHFDCKDFHLCGGVLLELNAIEAIPAADVKPVKRGKWVRNENNGLCYCSECDAPAPVEDVHGETISDAPYCYHCGAKMED